MSKGSGRRVLDRKTRTTLLTEVLFAQWLFLYYLAPEGLSNLIDSFALFCRHILSYRGGGITTDFKFCCKLVCRESQEP